MYRQEKGKIIVVLKILENIHDLGAHISTNNWFYWMYGIGE